MVPFQGSCKGMQALSRPVLFLSIATALSDRLENSRETSDHVDGSQVCTEPHPEQSIMDTRIHNLAPQSLPSENWLLQLRKELEQQGISLPARIDEDELRRFYSAANGDFSCLLALVKKTIRWRETYNILSEHELEMWSHFVFWHGYDVKLRPCLIIRLGLAFSTLALCDRPRFAQAIVSQIEYGVLNLVNLEDPQIMVLIDCEGLSTFKVPMQMIRSCSVLVRDNYPNRLGCLLVIRLRPVVRVIAQTLVQILRPATRKKLRIEGDTYQKILSEYLRTFPSFLGGKCKCARCSTVGICDSPANMDTDNSESSGNSTRGEDPFLVGDLYEIELQSDVTCQQVLRTAIISMLMLFIFIALIGGMYGSESVPLPF
ncbi:phosphatidylinositol/phosphatidylcholine transfer protein SFH2-like [Macadamia integrifolia]|uniref:phosphatidylinositol/phosphatidylcholine transfer protein SFH2-like n=1 Tax=Macadamia integrifolia TaxID=60698 RepID=UPI001C4FD8AB|nr:phosphatidylinositol/phosphatidylcholine transfer protein SFH2-like [Macadamia integrifolia]